MKKKAPTKRKTNVELITEIMEYSKYGVLAQVFVVNAILTMAKDVAALDPEKIEGKDWEFISFQAWQGIAKEICDKMDQNYAKEEK